MKIRTDFVTNSSSSSFSVVCVKTKEKEYSTNLDDHFFYESGDWCNELLAAKTVDEFVTFLNETFNDGWEETDFYKSLREIKDITDILYFSYEEHACGSGEMEDVDGNYVEVDVDFENKKFYYESNEEEYDSDTWEKEYGDYDEGDCDDENS